MNGILFCTCKTTARPRTTWDKLCRMHSAHITCILTHVFFIFYVYVPPVTNGMSWSAACLFLRVLSTCQHNSSQNVFSLFLFTLLRRVVWTGNCISMDLASQLTRAFSVYVMGLTSPPSDTTPVF